MTGDSRVKTEKSGNRVDKLKGLNKKKRKGVQKRKLIGASFEAI